MDRIGIVQNIDDSKMDMSILEELSCNDIDCISLKLEKASIIHPTTN